MVKNKERWNRLIEEQNVFVMMNKEGCREGLWVISLSEGKITPNEDELSKWDDEGIIGLLEDGMKYRELEKAKRTRERYSVE